MLVSIILPITLLLSYSVNVYGVAVLEGNSRRSAPAKNLPDLSTLPPLKTPHFINNTSPEGYKYTIDMANAIGLDTSKDVKTAGFIHPEVSPNPAFEVGKLLTRQRAKPQGENLCGDSSFINKSSPGSPLADDCWVIADTAQHWLVTNEINGFEIVPTGGNNYWIGLMWYGTCIFGVHTDFSAGVTWVGIEDVRDVVVDSINRFQWWDGAWKVGAEGEMGCVNALLVTPSNVKWAVFHT